VSVWIAAFEEGLSAVSLDGNALDHCKSHWNRYKEKQNAGFKHDSPEVPLQIPKDRAAEVSASTFLIADSGQKSSGWAASIECEAQSGGSVS